MLEVQQALREQLEREPVRFFMREAPPLLAAARERLAHSSNAPAAGLGFVRNATTAINSVLRSLPLAADDELLMTDHAYNASRNALEYAAAERGCRVVVAQVPFPTPGPDAVIEAVLARVTARTRLALLDHVTSRPRWCSRSPSSCAGSRRAASMCWSTARTRQGWCRSTCVRSRPPTTPANCHKWLCAPKGVGSSRCARTAAAACDPLAISHGANAPVPASALPDRVLLDRHRRSHACARAARGARFARWAPAGWVPGAVRAQSCARARGPPTGADALGVPLPCPDAMIGAMASLPVPALPGLPAPKAVSALELDPLHDALFRDHAIEVPVLTCPAHPGRLVRISAQAYNEIDDYERLAVALRTLARR